MTAIMPRPGSILEQRKLAAAKAAQEKQPKKLKKSKSNKEPPLVSVTTSQPSLQETVKKETTKPKKAKRAATSNVEDETQVDKVTERKVKEAKKADATQGDTTQVPAVVQNTNADEDVKIENTSEPAVPQATEAHQGPERDAASELKASVLPKENAVVKKRHKKGGPKYGTPEHSMLARLKGSTPEGIQEAKVYNPNSTQA